MEAKEFTPKQGERVYRPYFNYQQGCWECWEVEMCLIRETDLSKSWLLAHSFQTNSECECFCDKLNEAIKNVK